MTMNLLIVIYYYLFVIMYLYLWEDYGLCQGCVNAYWLSWFWGGWKNPGIGGVGRVGEPPQSLGISNHPKTN